MSFPLPSPPLADTKFFQLDARTDAGQRYFKIRLHIKRTGGIGPKKIPHVSFYTQHTIPTLEHWDRDANRVKDSAPNAKVINADLDRIKAQVLEAIEASMDQNEIRELMGITPVKPHAPYKNRSDKGSITVETAKKTLVEKGWKHNVTVDKPAEGALAEAAAAGLLHPDAETSRLLERFQNQGGPPRGLPDRMGSTQPPAPAREAESMPAVQVVQAQEYWVVSDEQELTDRMHFAGVRLNAEDARTHAVALAMQSQRAQFIFHCQPVARVQVAVQIDEL